MADNWVEKMAVKLAAVLAAGSVGLKVETLVEWRAARMAAMKAVNWVATMDE